MYTHISKKRVGNKTYEYLQLIEGYRVGAKVKKRILHNFGRIDNGKSSASYVQKLINQTKSITPQQLAETISTQEAKLYALPTAIYTLCIKELDLSSLFKNIFSNSHIKIDVLLLTTLMIIHRIIDPDSKLSLTRWYKHILLPTPLPKNIDVHTLYYTLDYLIEKKEPIEKALYNQLQRKQLIDATIVFYDLTSSYFEGEEVSMAHKGYSRDHRPDCLQITLGLVIDRKNGLPLYHDIFEGNMNDSKTVKEILTKLQTMYNLQNVIFVADKGMLTADNLKELKEKKYQSILSESIRNAMTQKQREDMFQKKDTFTKLKDLEETLWYIQTTDKNGEKIIVCYNQYTAAKAKHTRDEKIRKLKDYINETKKKHKDEIEKKAIQKVRDMILAKLVTARARKYFDTKEKDTLADLFLLKQEVVSREEHMDGMWVVRGNTERLTTQELITTYKDLKKIEASFRTIKDVIELRPVYHRKDERVKGHVFICILAFLVTRILEMKTETTVKMLREKYMTAVALPTKNGKNLILGGQELLSAVQA
jgi:transposase